MDSAAVYLVLTPEGPSALFRSRADAELYCSESEDDCMIFGPDEFTVRVPSMYVGNDTDEILPLDEMYRELYVLTYYPMCEMYVCQCCGNGPKVFVSEEEAYMEMEMRTEFCMEQCGQGLTIDKILVDDMIYSTNDACTDTGDDLEDMFLRAMDTGSW